MLAGGEDGAAMLVDRVWPIWLLTQFTDSDGDFRSSRGS
jgi:hypothetical protein